MRNENKQVELPWGGDGAKRLRVATELADNNGKRLCRSNPQAQTLCSQNLGEHPPFWIRGRTPHLFGRGGTGHRLLRTASRRAATATTTSSRLRAVGAAPGLAGRPGIPGAASPAPPAGTARGPGAWRRAAGATGRPRGRRRRRGRCGSAPRSRAPFFLCHGWLYFSFRRSVGGFW